MNKIQKQRLLNVAKALRESAVPRAFNMGFYGYDDYRAEKNKVGCGTPACALGHYAARRDLQKSFKLTKNDEVTDNNGKFAGFDTDFCAEHFGLDSSPNQYDNISNEADDLFGPLGCGRAKTPAGAAQYIERFVARKEKEARK